MRVCVANTVNKRYLGAVFNLCSKAPEIDKAKGIKKLSQNNLPFQPSASPSVNTYTHATHTARQFKNTLTEMPHMLFNPFRCHSRTRARSSTTGRFGDALRRSRKVKLVQSCGRSTFRISSSSCPRTESGCTSSTRSPRPSESGGREHAQLYDKDKKKKRRQKLNTRGGESSSLT